MEVLCLFAVSPERLKVIVIINEWGYNLIGKSFGRRNTLFKLSQDLPSFLQRFAQDYYFQYWEVGLLLWLVVFNFLAGTKIRQSFLVNTSTGVTGSEWRLTIETRLWVKDHNNVEFSPLWRGICLGINQEK